MGSLPVETAALGLAALSIILGLALIAAAVYLFSRRREMKIVGLPAWASLLAAGALLTLIVPGCLAFLLLYVLVSPVQPPPPTCYAPQPPTCYDMATTAMAGLVLGRKELLERLHGEGKIPDGVYRRLRK